ncbi:hypothetical protein [Pseudoalteromonas denitrificans]|uniref:Uncharacterized protein n=1 Tax=Pseudoalteromonas denitrificans DSM 6059 TaxID=1123010 RepID=A0A1I1JF95_9GAMM|nr:hypothetical protein [Pseudoalteromonas denitrificans]SFC45288.1 hypothetical protein SAMN02745724_01708 [Pseudoalteromonas denitrificans DSM 6059]
MSIAIPLTAGSEIQKTSVIRDQVNTTKSESKFGDFSNDIVKISQLARQKQLNEKSESNQNSHSITSESVRVSSTIGKAKSISNLTQKQATQLYNEIASFL